jgi:exopolyphosphatase / guanosine-5'-triphosphate,3'-diphosphate pyrophosphatase
MSEDAMSTCATLDVGSNSVLIHIARRTPTGGEVLVDRSEVCRLGEGLSRTGRIGEAATARTLEALSTFAALLADHHVDEVAVVGTMCLRVAENAAEFVDRVLRETGLEIEVIPGDEEARLSFLAVAGQLDAASERVALFDIGGGSTEFIFGTGHHIHERFSLDLGTIRPTETWLRSDPVTPAELAAMDEALAGELARLDDAPAFDLLMGMGGTLCNMAAVRHGLVSYDPELVEGTCLDSQEIAGQVERYRGQTIEARRAIPGLQPKRAEVILAGAAITRAVMGRLGVHQLRVSARGVRHGLMTDRFGMRAGLMMRSSS